MALSADLRGRVLRAHKRGEGSQRVLAERFAVGLGTVNEWLRLARAGQRAPRPRRSGPKPLGGTEPTVLAALVAERRDATLAEYAAMLEERVGRRFSRPALCRALARAGLPRKKRRSGPVSKSAPTSPRRGRPGRPRSSAGPTRAA